MRNSKLDPTKLRPACNAIAQSLFRRSDILITHGELVLESDLFYSNNITMQATFITACFISKAQSDIKLTINTSDSIEFTLDEDNVHTEFNKFNNQIVGDGDDFDENFTIEMNINKFLNNSSNGKSNVVFGMAGSMDLIIKRADISLDPIFVFSKPDNLGEEMFKIEKGWKGKIVLDGMNSAFGADFLKKKNIIKLLDPQDDFKNYDFIWDDTVLVIKPKGWE